MLLGAGCGSGQGVTTSAPASASASVTPSPTPTPSTTLTPTPSPSLLPATGALDPGRYYHPEQAARFSFTVPDGWATAEGGWWVYRESPQLPRDRFAGPGQVLLTIWTVSHVYTDACHHEATLVDAGTTIDELASLLVAQKGRVASAATDVTLGGFPAKRIELTVPADLDVTTCDGGFIRFWPDAGPDESGGVCCSDVGSTDVVYAVDVAGDRFAVVARHQASTTAEELAELEAIVASITIEPPATSPSSVRPLPIGDLLAGTTYAIPFEDSHMIVTVPAAGWFTIDTWFLGKDTLGDAGPVADGFYDLALLPYPVANVYGDPCHWKGSALTPPVGPTVDDLAAALAEQAGAAAIAPTDVTLGGHAGKKVELTIPDDVDTSTCDEGDYGRWVPAEDPSWYGPFTYGKGQRDTVYIIDVDGTRRVIDKAYLPGTTEADLAELDQLVASIRFED
jgi:hypothetical protein